ncbi:MAG: low molecular weight phosphatase family protein, partial [Nitrospiraceae bacterium]
SAGPRPAGLNPLAVQVMQEIGIDISHHRSKRVDEFLGQHFHYVITVCDRAKETCPIFPAASKVLHWSFAYPATAQGSVEHRQEVFRQVRDEIANRIRGFLDKGK